MELLIFVGLAFLLPLLTFKKTFNENKEVLDHKTTTCIKGILCVFVMLHNLGIDYLYTLDPDREFQGLLWVTNRIIEYIGGIAVGVFFFLSAFGLVRSYQKHGNKFLLKLIFKNALKLWLVAVSINLLEYLVFFKGAFETKDAILRILNLDFFNHFNRMNRHGWFIATLLALYVVFAVVFYISSLFKGKNKFKIACFIMAAIPVAFYLATLIAQNGGMYSREVWCFSLGILYALFYEKVNVFILKHYKLSLILSIIAYSIGFILQEETASFAACLFFVTLTMKVDIKSPVTEFLGKISLGVYLFLHFTTLVLSPMYQNNVWYWILINAGFISILSVILYIICFYIEKLIELIIKRKHIKRKNLQ